MMMAITNYYLNPKQAKLAVPLCNVYYNTQVEMHLHLLASPCYTREKSKDFVSYDKVGPSKYQVDTRHINTLPKGIVWYFKLIPQSTMTSYIKTLDDVVAHVTLIH